MTTDPVFPKGFTVFLPHEKAPDFVKCDISIEPKAFIDFLAANREYMSEKGYFKITIKEGRDGKWYPQVDTYKPNQAQTDA